MLRLVYGPGELGFDAAYSLVWGADLRQLQAPDYGAQVSPTPHPLANAVAALVSFTGDAGPGVMLALSFLAFAGLGVAGYVAGSRAFGVVAGVTLGAILLTRPLFVSETLQASSDIPFLALVLGALAMELGRERRGTPVLVMLALAGLLRPDAWPLAVAYAVYYLWPAERRGDPQAVVRTAALAFAAPALWLLTDLVTTGNPIYSFTRTRDLAAQLERERGLGAAMTELAPALEGVLGSGVTWAGLAIGAVAIVVAQSRARLPFFLLVFGIVNFLALGLAQLPLLNRYLLIPSAAIAFFAAAGVAAFAWLRGGVAVTAVVAVVLALSVPTSRTDLVGTLDHAAERRVLYGELLELADGVRDRRLAETCRPLQVAAYRPVPVLAYHLGVQPSDVEVVRPYRARSGLMFAPRLESLIGDVGLYPGVVLPSSNLELPKTFRQVQANDWGVVATRC